MKERADKVLADLKLVASRSRAKSLIEKGDVLVDGVVLKKLLNLLVLSAKIEISAPLFVVVEPLNWRKHSRSLIFP